MHMLYYQNKKKKSSYDIFLTSLLSLFVSNPLISWWQYYTAGYIFEGIKAIKSFIYPYLEQDPPHPPTPTPTSPPPKKKKTPQYKTDGDIFNRQPTKASRSCPLAGFSSYFRLLKSLIPCYCALYIIAPDFFLGGG